MTGIPFPTVYWPHWDVDATFDAGDLLPPESEGRLWAVLVFLYYGDKVALADIVGRGMCIPSGRIEAGETIAQASERECFEETGARLRPESRRLIGCYRMTPRSGTKAGQTRFCPVFIADALGFEPLPAGSESQGLFLAAQEDIADLYFFWDPLMAAVFEFADTQKQRYLSPGTPLSALFES
jgi:8-oxo-dGTP diphosphatase